MQNVKFITCSGNASNVVDEFVVKNRHDTSVIIAIM